MQRWRDPITFDDKLLPDGSVERTYSEGRIEWRRRLPDGSVEWHDNSGVRGVDQALGGGIIRRTFQTGRVIYGREQGHGRTAWSDGTLTHNRTQFGGRMGSILAGLGAGVLLGELIAPPESLSLEEEEALRQAAEEQQRGAEQSGDFGDGGSGGGDFSGDDGSTSDRDAQVESGGSDSSWDSSENDAWTGASDDQAGMDDFGGGADLEDSFG